MKTAVSGEVAEVKRFVSAQQVAARAGVSRSAVSRAFTPGASVAPETREKVMRAAAELGYHVNDLARSLLAHKSRLVGLVATKPEVGFRAHLVAALTRALIRRGNVPFLINTGSAEEELLAAQAALFGYRAEATVILSGSPPASFVEIARQNGQAVVMIGRTEPDCDHVRTDNVAAARMVAARFAGQGFRRLAFAGSQSGTPSIVERETAFLDEARRLGATVLSARGQDSDYAGGRQAANELFKGSQAPEAVFCVNDLVAIGVLDAIRSQFGLRVPEDVSVVGFDDIPEASWEPYRLSTFRQDPEEIATLAIQQIERRLATPSAVPSTALLQASFIERATTRPGLDQSEPPEPAP